MLRSRKPGVIGSLMAVAVGVVFILAGFYIHRSHVPYVDGISTTATITAINSERNTKGRLMYSAVYTFTAADGHQVSFQDPGSASSRPEVGATAEVSYRAAEPERARRVPAVDWFGWGIVAGGVLLALLGAGNVIGRLGRLLTR